MKKLNLFKDLQTVIKKHTPEILTGIGIAGMITTSVMAVKATPKALLLIEDRKYEVEGGRLTPMEYVKTAGYCYIPASLTCVMSVACLIGASSINIRRNTALAVAYTISESALKEYQEKVIEIIGDKKEVAVTDAIAKDHIERNPVSKNEVIITEKGNTLCYDVISGRYFKSDINKLKSIQNELNRVMINDTHISLNDLYYEIGLTDTKIGEDLGWNINNGLIDLKFSTQLADDGTPCLVIGYRVEPQYNFYL